MIYLPLLLVQAFSPRFRLGLSVAPPFGRGVPHEPRRRQDLLRRLLTSAPRSDRLPTASVADATRRRSPGVSAAAFRAQSPDLRVAPLMDMDFAVSRPLVRHARLLSGSCPSTRTFAPCFFQTPPRGGGPCIITRPSPPSGWPEDLHLQAAAHAQHTTKPLARRTLRVRRARSAG